MDYESRAADEILHPTEHGLILLIEEQISQGEAKVKAKEAVINALAQLYVDNKTPQRIESIAKQYSKYFQVFSKPRLAKIVKNLVEYIAKVKGTEQLQISLSKYLIEWCLREKRNYLKHRIEVKLASLYLQINDPAAAMHIIQPILIEVRKADDKLLLIELYLLESKINYQVRNYAKAKASLTASRANANNVYCQPSVMAEIDLMSGILYAQDQDYKTSYAYFYEALDPLIATNDPRAVYCFKYMVMCKIMTGTKDEVNSLINGKFGLRFSADLHVAAINAVSNAHFDSSIVALTRVFQQFRPQIKDDPVVSNHTARLYDQLLEKNLFKIILSYTRVDILYIAQKLCLGQDIIEHKLSEMILDKKIIGTLDQSKGCLIVYHEQKKDKLYSQSAETIDQLTSVVNKLTEASAILKKAH